VFKSVDTLAPNNKEIPFFYQSNSNNCIQTNMKMTLKHFSPGHEYDFQILDQLTGRSGDQWTWPAQAVKPMVDNCMDIYFYSTTPYKQITPEFLKEFYGISDGVTMIAHTNWEVLPGAIDYILTSGRYQKRKTTFAELEEAFNQGSSIIVTLQFHQVTVVGINETHVTVHDPGKGPNVLILRDDFISLWDGTPSDNDIFIIKGRIPGCEV